MGYRNAPDEPGRPSGGERRAHPRFSAIAREERGQSLVVIVISMTLIVAVAALAIDASAWFAKHHQAQVTADAAALAAANYMGTAIAAGTAPATASPTGTTTAVTYAAKNGLPISPGNVTINTDPSAETVTVTVPTTGPLFFAGISLGSGPSISARAVASWAIQDCSTGGSNCDFAYAADNVCSGNTGVTSSAGVTQHGITIYKNGTGSGPAAISGDVISASNITLNINGNPTFSGVAAYSDVTGCLPLAASSLVPPFAAAYRETITPSYPVKYQTIYPACPGKSSLFKTVTCVPDPANPSLLFPSYCTQGAAYENQSSVASVSNNSSVYCNAGTGNPQDPSTWNGTTTVTAGGQGSTVDATYIAGTVNLQIPSNTNMGPASGNKLLAYGAECNATTPPLSFCPATATATTNPAVSITATGNPPISGDFFAPGGVIDAAMGGTPSLTGFLEGWDVVYNAHGTVVGEGPPVNNMAQFVGDYLIQ